MRSLIVGLLMIFSLVDMADARVARGRRLPDTELLLAARVRVFAGEERTAQAKGVVFRYGRTYWSLSEFGDCYAELETPKETVRVTGKRRAIVDWEGRTYWAHCLDNDWNTMVFWEKVKKSGKK